jgi:hypothetical protein
MLLPSILPFDESIVFRDSSFFTQLNTPSLPSPAEVRTSVNANDTRSHDHNRAQLVRFTSLNLMVKYGCTVTIAEGQCLWALRHLLRDFVPVPDIYGWCRDGNEAFLYMQLISGPTLEERWQTLDTKEKASVCEQLCQIVEALSLLQQDPNDQFIGKQSCSLIESDSSNMQQATLDTSRLWISYSPAAAPPLLGLSPMYHPFTTFSSTLAVPIPIPQENHPTPCVQNSLTML